MADLRDFQSKQNEVINPSYVNIVDLLQPNQELAVEDYEFIPYFPEQDFIIGTEGLLEAGVTPMVFGHTIFTTDGDFRYEPSSKVNGNEGDTDFSGESAELDSSDSDEISFIKSTPGNFESTGPAGIKAVPGLAPLNTRIFGPGQAGPNTRVFGPGPTGPNTRVFGPRPAAPRKPVPLPSNNNGHHGPPGYFKREIINRALKRQQYAKDEDKSLDPLIKYAVKFDSTTNKLTLNDFEIIVDERTHTMQCATCGFARRETRRAVGSVDLEWKLKVHIIAAHIGFKCLAPDCSFQCSNHPTLLGHLKTEHTNVANNNHMNPQGLQQNNSNHNVRGRAIPNILQQRKSLPPKPGLRSSPRNPQQQPMPSITTPASASPSASTSMIKNSPPKKPSTSNSSGIRTCPVSNCRRTFNRKDEFIRHLQGHRKQSKMQQKPTEVVELNDEEPELVVLD